MAMSLLERLSRRGDVAPATAGQTPLPGAGLSGQMGWGSGFGGMQAIIDEELKKLMMQRLLQQQMTAQRHIPPGMGQGGR